VQPGSRQRETTALPWWIVGTSQPARALTSASRRLRLPRVGMNAMLRLNFLIICAGLTFGARFLPPKRFPFFVRSDGHHGANPDKRLSSDSGTASRHTMAIERNRQQAEAAAKRTPTTWPRASKLYKQNIAASA